MFKRANRMTTALFKRFNDVKGEHTKNFFIQYTKNEDGGENRFATIVSKKTCSTAACRNRIKRKIRASLEELKLFKPTSTPLLIAIFAKKGSQDLSVSEIVEELRYAQVFHSL